MRQEEDVDDPPCPACAAPDPGMAPPPEDDAGWEDPEPEPEPEDDLGAGLRGRLGAANVFTGILSQMR